jgi:hypothetical protein
MAEGPRRDSVIRELFARIPPEQLAARRLFVGRDVNKASVVELSDRKGIPRLQMMVDSLGTPVINFLNEEGTIVRSVTE